MTRTSNVSVAESRWAIGEMRLLVARHSSILTRRPRVLGTSTKAWGVVTNDVELSKWIDALQTDDVLSSDTRKKLFKPNQESCGCGWEVFSFSEGCRCIGHGGTVRGYTSKLWWFPNDDALLVVLANYDSFQYDMLNALKELMYREATTQDAR
ncbi:serine hydrolase domain-containing protein [Adhaeretor mobilis]|uniref:Beta-lactamase-related domain-containing protein n=1 Tax=Adhaeretor mobilis TaxID=1930276 RepID=A0A517N2X8_9BACT|nr:hypothetical protein [Adhaeretor mobilis]QDT01490.1 hypothetical protein HG15A2_48320 [Adhaeretor mobilis]